MKKNLILISILFSFNIPFLFGNHKKIHINCFRRIWDNFHSVERGIFYRSGQTNHKRLANYIKKYSIKSVINLRGKNENRIWWKAEKRVVNELGVNFYNLRFSAQKSENKNEISRLLFIYKTAPRPILVHCLSGVDRTGEASALWVLEQQHKSKKQALKQLSVWYRYNKFKNPSKYLLVKNWTGLENF